MFQFHYTDGIGDKVSLVRTLFKKYDLFSNCEISTMDSVSTVKRKVKL